MPHSKINARWFRSQLESNQISQRRLAKALHLDPSAVTLFLKGKRRLQMDEATEVARLLNVPLEDVLENAGIALGEVTTDEAIKISGWVDGQLNVHLEPPRGPKTAPKPSWGGRDLKVVRFQTSGSVLESMDGALAYYRSQSGVSADAINRICVLELGKPGNVVLGVPKKGYRAGQFAVFKLNGELLIEETLIKAAFPLIWMKM